MALSGQAGWSWLEVRMKKMVMRAIPAFWRGVRPSNKSLGEFSKVRLLHSCLGQLGGVRANGFC